MERRLGFLKVDFPFSRLRNVVVIRFRRKLRAKSAALRHGHTCVQRTRVSVPPENNPKFFEHFGLQQAQKSWTPSQLSGRRAAERKKKYHQLREITGFGAAPELTCRQNQQSAPLQLPKMSTLLSSGSTVKRRKHAAKKFRDEETLFSRRVFCHLASFDAYSACWSMLGRSLT